MEGYDIMWEDELFDEIQKGDDVYYENEQGQTCKGTATVSYTHLRAHETV